MKSQGCLLALLALSVVVSSAQHDARQLSSLLSQLEQDIHALPVDDNSDVFGLEEQPGGNCPKATWLGDRTSEDDMPAVAIGMMLDEATRANVRGLFKSTLHKMGFVEEPFFLGRVSAASPNVFPRTEWQPAVDLVILRKAVDQGMCDMVTKTKGGSIFMRSGDGTLVLKSMIANEPINWESEDRLALAAGTYPPAILPALMKFSRLDAKGRKFHYFVMPGAYRLGKVLGSTVSDLRLFDVKGMLDGKDEKYLRKQYTRFTIEEDLWKEAVAQMADGLYFLCRHNRMDFSMFVAVMEKNIVSEAMENNIRTRYGTDHGVMIAHSRNPKSGKAERYAIQLHGFVDQLEKLEDKTTGNTYNVVVNAPRVDSKVLSITSNPMLSPPRYACRMLVYMSLYLLLPFSGAIPMWDADASTMDAFVSRCIQTGTDVHGRFDIRRYIPAIGEKVGVVFPIAE